jgi:hypothetical protein
VPALRTGQTVTPPAVATVAAVPAPAAAGGAGTSPAAVAAFAAVLAATLSTGQTATPAAVAVLVAIPGGRARVPSRGVAVVQAGAGPRAVVAAPSTTATSSIG